MSWLVGNQIHLNIVYLEGNLLWMMLIVKNARGLYWEGHCQGFLASLSWLEHFFHLTTRNHDKLDEDGFFLREVRAVKAQCALANEDKPDNPNRAFLLKHVCTMSKQTYHACMVGALALLIGSDQFERVQWIEMKV